MERLPLEVFVRNDNTGPVVILQSGRVFLANEAAADLGIQPGSNMDTAITLSESLVSFEKDETRELSTLSQLAQWAYQFTPNVSIKPPDRLLLDIAGCIKLFNGLENLKKQITRGINELGYTAVLGVHGTPQAAVYTALAKAPENSDLAPLPTEYLQVDRKIIESLHKTGIYTFEDLFRLPESSLNRRYGIFLVDHLQRLTGKKPDPQKWIGPRPEFGSEITFLSDVTNTASLIFPIKRLLNELCGFLTARQLHVNRFTWRLSHRSHPATSFSIYLANPENDLAMFLALTQLHLDKLDDVEEVDCLRLSASVFFPATSSSGDLFHGTRFRQKDGRIHEGVVEERANRLLNMLTARLGPQACFGLSLANDHRPEKAWKSVMPNRKANEPSIQPGDQPDRPLYLLDRPRLLTTIKGTPSLGGKLELLKGPERIDFGWWDQSSSMASQCRDYYVARHGSGSLYWIFNYHNNAKWYLHGIFS